MEISYQISWRRSTGTHECNSTHVTNSILIDGESTISCMYGCSGTITSLISYVCTYYSAEDDWSFGEYHKIYFFNSVSDQNTVTIGTYGCCWINRVNSHWNVSTTFSLVTRTDTGKINSSPRIKPTPPLYLQQGCSYTIPLPVSDPDNDIVRCRWAVGTECRDICDEFPGALLDSSTCTIAYIANNGTGIKAAAIMIEDYAPGSPCRPLSSVALQFSILVFSSSQPCSTSTTYFVFPSIILHPSNVLVHLTDLNISCTLTCKATEGSSYYWEKENGKIPVTSTGANSDTLTLINVKPENAGRYRCVAFVYSIRKSNFSNYATVTINSKFLFCIFINYVYFI